MPKAFAVLRPCMVAAFVELCSVYELCDLRIIVANGLVCLQSPTDQYSPEDRKALLDSFTSQPFDFELGRALAPIFEGDSALTKLITCSASPAEIAALNILTAGPEVVEGIFNEVLKFTANVQRFDKCGEGNKIWPISDDLLKVAQAALARLGLKKVLSLMKAGSNTRIVIANAIADYPSLIPERTWEEFYNVAFEDGFCHRALRRLLELPLHATPNHETPEGIKAIEVIVRATVQAASLSRCWASRVLDGLLAIPDLQDEILWRFRTELIDSSSPLPLPVSDKLCTALVDNFTKAMEEHILHPDTTLALFAWLIIRYKNNWEHSSINPGRVAKGLLLTLCSQREDRKLPYHWGSVNHFTKETEFFGEVFGRLLLDVEENEDGVSFDDLSMVAQSAFRSSNNKADLLKLLLCGAEPSQKVGQVLQEG